MRRAKPLIIPLDSDLAHFSITIAVLIVRTYAVWNKDKRVGIGLALLLGLCQIPSAIVEKRFIEMIQCGHCLDSSFIFRS